MARAAAGKNGGGKPSASPQFERVALLLQGGLALGAYQGGVYQALAEANVLPTWIAGISIGAINSAIVAGNAPENRVARLRQFWETVSSSPLAVFGTPLRSCNQPQGQSDPPSDQSTAGFAHRAPWRA
jgi:predicted acylesterase/phospholipase RssA